MQFEWYLHILIKIWPIGNVNMLVRTGVWVVAHAQLGSVAAKARQLDATCVILGRYGCRKLFF